MTWRRRAPRRLLQKPRALAQNLLDGLSAGQRPPWTLVDAAWTSEGSSAARRDNTTSRLSRQKHKAL
jgi:hypothetical protein